MNRRSFIGSSLSFAGLAVCRPGIVFAAEHGKYLSGKPNLVFGVASDIHVRPLYGRKGEYFTEFWRKALELFRDQGADAVIAAGDLCNFGVTDEMQAFADTWFDVFPDDKAPDGRKVERIFVYGNHDVSLPMARRACNNDKNEMKKRAIALDRAGCWKRIFKEEFSDVYRKTVKGYDFIGAHWEGGLKGFGDSFCKGLEAFYDKIGPSLDKTKPFFHVQHPHPKGTCHGETVWGQDDGISTKILSRHPNAVSFSGHSHNSLLDERAIWQGAFTSVGTATASHIGLSSLKSGVESGFENYRTYGKTAKAKEKADRSKVMPMMDRTLGRQAQVVRVYDDRIIFSRYDLYDQKPLAEDLVMPLDTAKAKPFAFAPRYEVAKQPQFPEGAKVTVSFCEANRRGDAKKAKKTKTALISVPAANTEPSARGVYYKVVAECGAKKLTVSVIHDSYRFRAGDSRSERPLKCRIALDRLPKGDVTFKVTAFSWWDKPSRTLEAICKI
ncbi:MAG: metallophosphoesterase [Kiritimatiellae bacterium]|nr:metallophosphoesterase [Kiritimatiellia bacterium]